LGGHDGFITLGGCTEDARQRDQAVGDAAVFLAFCFLEDGQRSTGEFCRFVELSLFQGDPCEILQGISDTRVILADVAFADLKVAARDPLGFVQVAGLSNQPRQVVQTGGELDSVGPERLFVELPRWAVSRLGEGIITVADQPASRSRASASARGTGSLIFS
jgi:hypothetical protein